MAWSNSRPLSMGLMSCNSIVDALLQSGQKTDKRKFPSRRRIRTLKKCPQFGHLTL